MNTTLPPDWPLLVALGAAVGFLAVIGNEWALARYRQWQRRRSGAEPGWILAPALRTVFYLGVFAVSLLGLWLLPDPARDCGLYSMGLVSGFFVVPGDTALADGRLRLPAGDCLRAALSQRTAHRSPLPLAGEG